MDGLGTGELLMIFIFILIFFGPEKLPEFARKLGYYYRKLNEYRRFLDEEIKKGYLEAEKMVTFKEDSDKLKFRPVEKDELYQELLETARELGIDPKGKSSVDLAREIREKLAERDGVKSNE